MGILMIRALIFDFDGLIMDTESPEVEAWQIIYAEHGQEFPLETWIRKVVGASASNFDPAAHLAQLTGTELDLPSLHERERAYRLARQAVMPTRPGVVEYLNAARQLGLQLAVASSSKHAWVDGYLRQLGLGEYFDLVKAREDAARVKPEPDLYLAALSGLGLSPADVLAFEDSPNGVLSAKRAGIRVVAVPNPITTQMKIEGADILLASLAERPLPELLKELGEELLIRPERPEDIPSIHDLEQAAFGRGAEADLVDLIRSRGKAILSLVAEDAGSLVGHVLFSPVILEGWFDLRGLGLGPIAVHPEIQHKGIGSRLIRAGLAWCREQGYDYVVLLGDPHYYSRFGFRTASGLGLGNEYGVDEEFMAVELYPQALKGADGVVKYAAEFAEAGC